MNHEFKSFCKRIKPAGKAQKHLINSSIPVVPFPRWICANFNPIIKAFYLTWIHKGFGQYSINFIIIWVTRVRRVPGKGGRRQVIMLVVAVEGHEPEDEWRVMCKALVRRGPIPGNNPINTK